jgi:heparan-alpha-glucosaminide N-acetyltransferase
MTSVPALAPSKTAATVTPQPASTRYLALDAYRGFIMLVLVSGGFGFAGLAERNPAFAALANQFEHQPWEWITFWDLIQPAFMFMVGVAMPFALAQRIAAGATSGQLLRHVAARSFRLLLMSQILISISRGKMQFQLTNVLAQIALTYFLCYLIMQLKFRWQVMVAASLLIGHWLLYVAFPGSEGAFYSKTTNIGVVIDDFIFHKSNPGHWVSINFITSTVTTLFGMWTGRLLQSDRSSAAKMRIMGAAAAACLLIGWAIHPWNPIIKRICTSSFTIYSTGWVLLMLLAFYWVIEVKKYRQWTYPFLVLGANSIFIYSIDLVLRSWLNTAVGVFTLHFEWLGQFAPVGGGCVGLLCMWSVCWWLYRRKLFLKL